MGKGQGGGKQIGSGYTIRVCRSHPELRNCVKLQKRIWGLEDRELYPERIFVVTNKIGGAVLGAFDPQGQPAGFLVYIPAWDEIGRYYCSLALGISAQHQNRGLGRALKLEQRRRALEAGVDRIKWTFDPLRIKKRLLQLVRTGSLFAPLHSGPLRAACDEPARGAPHRPVRDRMAPAFGACPARGGRRKGKSFSRGRQGGSRPAIRCLEDGWAEPEGGASRAIPSAPGVRLGKSEAFYLLESYED